MGSERSARNVVAAIVVFVGLMLLPVLFTGCEPPAPAEASPAPEPASMELAAMAQDTFTVIAAWPPVEFLGDTVSTYRRTLVRTDTSGLALEDTISALGSETLEVVGPPAGETAVYDYCLWSRAPNEAGEVVESQEAACTSFQFTSPTSFPQPPDSVEIEEPVAMVVDSVTVSPDSATIEVGQTFQFTALVWRDGEIVGCSGDCAGVEINAGTWDQGTPLYLTGRIGAPGEWVAQRLPWLRVLG